MENSENVEKFCRITMQLPLFQLKLKTFPLPRRRDHFNFMLRFSSKLLIRVELA